MLLIYDGDCGFCTTSAKWYARRAGDRARIAPWQALDLGDVGLTEDQATTSLWFRRDDGELFDGADGCAAAMKATPAPWNVLGHLLALPGVIHVARLIYPIIARNRHQLPGATDACRLDIDA